MPKRTRTTGLNSIYRAKLDDLASRLDMPPRELEACIGAIVGGLAAAFILVQKPSGSWLPLMHVKTEKEGSTEGMAETISCWFEAGAEKIVVAAKATLPADARTVVSLDLAGVRFTVLVSGHLSASEPTSSATDAALA